MNVTLSPEEQFAFAALARVLVRLDGRFSEEEEQAIEAVAAELFATTTVAGPYRSMPEADAADGSAVWDLIERAAETVPDDDALKAIAAGVTRPAAREAIYEAIYAVAASDVVAKEEWPMLEWLAAEWGIAAT
ncbi:MAG: TerB family tellurite resistance protein [Labilithrix sp.]|nr:TerB family tellurite resistance protein [Labilithrix sp.]MCW5809523.1 TerB family tellurite resistance protein [Labilithrix sp.]